MNRMQLIMKSDKWTTVNALLACCVVLACKVYVPCAAAAEIGRNNAHDNSKNNVFDKYKCKVVDDVSEESAFPFFSTHAPHSSGIKLNCTPASTSYVNVSEYDFQSGLRPNGALELDTAKLEAKTYCVSDQDGQRVRLAVCRNNSHREYVQQSQPQPHHQPNEEKQQSNENLEQQPPSPPTQPHQNDEHHDDILISRVRQTIRLRKCCDTETARLVKRQENGQELFHCVETEKSWNPAIFNNTKDDYSSHVDLDKFSNSSAVTFGFPLLCARTDLKALYNSHDIWFMILANSGGSVEIGLKFWFKPVWLPVHDNEFCLDEVVDHDPPLPNETRIDSHGIYHKNQALLYCEIPNFDDYLFHRRLFGGMCVGAAGIVFVLLIIYVAIWDRQNLAGWTQFNIFVALFFVVLMEGLRTLVDADALQVQSTKACVIVAAVAQYFFFALNTTWSVMCFDLFYMFWKLETTSKTVGRYQKRLIGYLLFSWGLPLFVVCIAFYFTHNTMMEEMDHMQGVYAFAHRRCSSPIRKLGFQAQGIMFLLNLMFFLLTTLLIWKHRRGLNAARKRSRNERYTWRSVCLFMKLVIVMGVASLSVPLDFFFVSSAPLSTTAICFRMVHFIPFVAVLFIFGFNEKNMILISQKYPRIGRYFGFVACTSGATASDTANHSRSANRTSDHPSSSPT